MNAGEAHVPAAEDWVRKAIEADRRNGTAWFLAKDYASLAGILQRKGELTETRKKLKKGLEVFKECGAVGWVERYEHALAQL